MALLKRFNHGAEIIITEDAVFIAFPSEWIWGVIVRLDLFHPESEQYVWWDQHSIDLVNKRIEGLLINPGLNGVSNVASVGDAAEGVCLRNAN